MKELGAFAKEEHTKIAKQIAEIAQEYVFWKGAFGDVISNTLKENNYNGFFFEVVDTNDFICKLNSIPKNEKEKIIL